MFAAALADSRAPRPVAASVSVSNESEESAIAAEDRTVHQAWDRGDFHAAATLLLARYDSDIRRLIASRVRSEAAAAEVLSDFYMDLWRGLPGFAWRCPAKAWAMTVARNAANRYLRAPWRRPCRNIALDDIQEPSVQPGALAGSSTPPLHLDDEIKRRVRAIRRTLRPEERLILQLRVERQMAWRDLTLALHGPVDDAATLRRLTARMRKRFQLIKDRIRNAALSD